MKIIALVNNKGGVAKTTTAVNLSAALASDGQRVLLVDLDCQGSASLSLGIKRADLYPSSADILIDGYPIREAIRKTSVDNLHLITGSMQLANADVLLAEVTGREFRLKQILAELQNDYDYVFIDCPPSLSLLPVNALVASEYFLVPVVTHYLAMEGLVNLLEAVDLIHKGIGSKTEMLGIVLTMVDFRTKSAREIMEIMRGSFPGKVFESLVRMNVRLQEAPSHGQTIFQYDWSSSGAVAYRGLAAEVHQRCTGAKPNEQTRQTGEGHFQFNYAPQSGANAEPAVTGGQPADAQGAA